jgi:acetylornithine deacetylase
VTEVDTWLRRNTADLVQTAQTLVRYRTESVDLLSASEPLPNDERALQAYIAGRLNALGCQVDQWEPDPVALRGHRMIPDRHHWHGRPMTAGRLPGTGGGRSLLINGHIDTVPAGDPELWAYPPFAAEVHADRIYGRGTADMKGGTAAALLALEALSACRIQLLGDVIFATVTDEEIGGMGTIAAAERGHLADAAVIPEPTGLQVLTATRGILWLQIDIQGREAHAEVAQPPWREGGGVNANNHAVQIATALIELGRQRKTRPSLRHPLLSAPDLEITEWHGGEYPATLPGKARLVVNVTGLPGEADAGGFGSNVLAEVGKAIAGIHDADGWLAEHPPQTAVLLDYPAYEIPADSPIVQAVQAAANATGSVAQPVGLDSGYDGTLLGNLYRVPSVAYGPGGISEAHTTKEHVAIDDLTTAARGYARLMIDWCGLHRAS